MGFGADMTAWEGAEGNGRRRFLAFWRAVLTANRAEVQVHAARQTYDGPARRVVVVLSDGDDTASHGFH